MLTEADISRAADKLAQFRRENAFQQILENYGSLIEEYLRLRSDYEEERNARERYKQLAKGTEKNPFVLVLVDGDQYVFSDSLMDRDNPEAGALAAKLLHDKIQKSLRLKGLEHCSNVMVRIYANVLGLSKRLAKAGLAGAESRSLGHFIANFNRAYGLFDFVDAGKLKENADFKLRAMLRLHADNSQCKHIYFAACHDSGYISELTSFMGKRDRFTLIKSGALEFHPEYESLGLGIEELTGVFRTSPLQKPAAIPEQVQWFKPPTAIATRKAAAPAVTTRDVETRDLATPDFSAPDVATPDVPASPITSRSISRASRSMSRPSRSISRASSVEPKSPAPSVSSKSRSSAKESGGKSQSNLPCSFYPVGKCKYGLLCSRNHSDTGLAASTWRTKPEKKNIIEEVQLENLPLSKEIPEGYVAVNENQHRLDPRTLPHVLAAAKRLGSSGERVCNKYHLTGTCPQGDGCIYGHEPLSKLDLEALHLLSRKLPCSKQGACRDPNCIQGHICQVMDCTKRGGRARCKLPIGAHSESAEGMHFVPGKLQSFDVSINGDAAAYSSREEPPHAPLQGFPADYTPYTGPEYDWKEPMLEYEEKLAEDDEKLAEDDGNPGEVLYI